MLIFIGGHTTTSGAGMAFADWPLSNGSLNPAGWWQNFMMRLEHGHRLTAGLVTTLVLILFLWILARRRTLPRAAFRPGHLAALVGVFSQAILGGLRVILDPQGIAPTTSAIATTFRILHACFAQVEVCLVVSLAAVLSPLWSQLAPHPGFRKVARLAWVTTGFIFFQLIVGATMRHLGAGLAIPTFPLTPEGSFMPKAHNAFIDLNFTHTRIGAALVAIHVFLLTRRALGTGEARLARPVLLLVALLVAQITLGMLVIWDFRPPVLTTLHVVNGAALLATAVLIAVRAGHGVPSDFPSESACHPPAGGHRVNRATQEIAMPLEVPREAAEPGIVSDLLVLTKARLSLLVIITTFVGFCAASGARLDWLLMAHAVIGTTLAAAAAAVLNQFIEIKVDRLMERTRFRPLPAGRIKPMHALVLGVVMGVVGVAWLAVSVNALSSALAAATILTYIAAYTPLKRRTSLCTIVGAVSGAIPPMIGWVAVKPSFDLGAWMLFGILFTWQMPHFLAIAWMYRDEYAQAGFVMLRRDDVSGSKTAMQSLLYTAALIVITLIPYHAGMNNDFYLGGALLLDGVMFLFAVQFLVERERASARRLFFASIIFLPLILGLMVLTRN